MNEGRKGCTFAKGSKGQKREIEREREREMGLERGKGMVMSRNHI